MQLAVVKIFHHLFYVTSFVILISCYFQHLTRKKDRSDCAVASWKVQSKHNVLMTKTVEALADMNPNAERTSQKQKKRKAEKIREQGEKTQALALQIANHIDSMGTEKSKPSDG